MKKEFTNKQIVEETSRLLEEKRQDWESNYSRIAKEINNNLNDYLKKASGFRVRGAVDVFSTKTNVQKNTFSLRFAGLTIGEITVKGDGKEKDVRLSVRDEHVKRAKNLGYSSDFVGFENKKWDDVEPSKYRSFFNSLETTDQIKKIAHIQGVSKFSEELRLEHWLISEMASGTSNIIRNIRPTLLGNRQYFKMPTPFSVSKHTEINYSTGYGGIDILARVGLGLGNHLSVIELKDQYLKDEPQMVTLQQALAYATFLAYLLRSNVCGKTWWTLFGKGGTPDKYFKKIDAVSLMPVDVNGIGKECTDYSPIPVPGVENVTIYPYKLYFKTDQDGNPNSFKGNYNLVLPQ